MTTKKTYKTKKPNKKKNKKTYLPTKRTWTSPFFVGADMMIALNQHFPALGESSYSARHAIPGTMQV